MGTITDRLAVSNAVFDENFAINIKARSQFQNQTRYWINILPDVTPTACLVTVWYTPVGGTSIAALDANGSAITIDLTAPKPVYIDGDVNIITLVHSGLTVGSMTSYGVTVAVDTGGTGQSSGTASTPTVVSYSTASPVSRSGTITTGGEAQVLMAANTARKGWFLQNNSTGDLWVNRFGGTASAAQPSILIKAGRLYETPAGGSGGNALSIFGATTGQAFTAGEW